MRHKIAGTSSDGTQSRSVNRSGTKARVKNSLVPTPTIITIRASNAQKTIVAMSAARSQMLEGHKRSESIATNRPAKGNTVSFNEADEI